MENLGNPDRPDWKYVEYLKSTITHLESQQKHDLDKLAKAEARIKELEGCLLRCSKWFVENSYSEAWLVEEKGSDFLKNLRTLLKGDTP